MLPGMDEATRRRALRQTARIVFGGMCACGATTQTNEARIEPLPTPTATAANTQVQTPPPPTSACAIGLDQDGGLLKGSLMCCLDATRVASTAKDGGTGWSGQWITEHPELVPCCQAIAGTGRLMSLAFSGNWSPTACRGCADAIGQPSACTPWGPPMPPPMSWGGLAMA